MSPPVTAAMAVAPVSWTRGRSQDVRELVAQPVFDGASQSFMSSARILIAGITRRLFRSSICAIGETLTYSLPLLRA